MCVSYALLTRMSISGKLVCISEGCRKATTLLRSRLVPKLAYYLEDSAWNFKICKQ